MRSGPRSLLLAAVLTLAVVGLAAPARAATCTFNAPTVTVDVPDGDVTAIARSGDAITVGGVACGTATVTTTDTIVVNTPGFPLEVAIDLAGGPFAPGVVDEGDGGSEIEFTMNLPVGVLVRIVGSAGDDDIVVGSLGINLNASETTGDPDVTLSSDPLLLVEGGAGADTLSVGGGSGTGAPGPVGTLSGQAGDDRLEGALGASQLDGGDGVDTADYGAATQLVLADLFTGIVDLQSGASDVLFDIEGLSGSPGDDVIVGNDADNFLGGAGGADLIHGNGGDDAIDGGAGTDTIDFEGAPNGMVVDLANHEASGQGQDTIDGVENVLGSASDDDITGDAADNILAGGPGDDTIDGGDGSDTLVGGDGKDTVAFASSNQAVTVDLGKGTAKGAGSDTLDGFEDVAGSGKADTITGNKGPNDIDGKGGGDRVTGGNGTDDIIGGDGNDILFGGNGNDLIKGGNGKDQLNGGKGSHDICKGNADPDSFVFCENYPT